MYSGGFMVTPLEALRSPAGTALMGWAAEVSTLLPAVNLLLRLLLLYHGVLLIQQLPNLVVVVTQAAFQANASGLRLEQRAAGRRSPKGPRTRFAYTLNNTLFFPPLKKHMAGNTLWWPEKGTTKKYKNISKYLVFFFYCFFSQQLVIDWGI